MPTVVLYSSQHGTMCRRPSRPLNGVLGGKSRLIPSNRYCTSSCSIRYKLTTPSYYFVNSGLGNPATAGWRLEETDRQCFHHGVPSQSKALVVDGENPLEAVVVVERSCPYLRCCDRSQRH